MPKIEKDLLKVKGSDGQWHYVPAVGGSVDTAPTWDAVQNKPFTTLGDGLEVDENGVLSAEGGSGSDNAVQYVAQELTDEQKAQARENIGAGTSSFSGSYNDLTSKPTIPTQVTIDSTLKQSGQAADAKAVGDALQHFTPTEALNSEFREIELTFATKLDKNQGTGNAGKILGIGEDGSVIPQDKPTYTLTDADKTAVADEVVAGGIAATLVNMPSGGGGAYKLLYSTTLEQAAVVSVDMTEEAAACGEYIISLAIPSGESAVVYNKFTKIAGSYSCATNIATVSNTYGTLQLINVKRIDDQKNLIELRYVNTISTTPTLETAERTAWSVKRITVVPITYVGVLFDSAIELPAGTIIRIGGK